LVCSDHPFYLVMAPILSCLSPVASDSKSFQHRSLSCLRRPADFSSPASAVAPRGAAPREQSTAAVFASGKGRRVSFEEPEPEEPEAPEVIGNRRRANSVFDLEAMVAESDARTSGLAVEDDYNVDPCAPAIGCGRRRVMFECPESDHEEPEFIGNRRRANSAVDLDAMVAESDARMSALRADAEAKTVATVPDDSRDASEVVEVSLSDDACIETGYVDATEPVAFSSRESSAKGWCLGLRVARGLVAHVRGFSEAMISFSELRFLSLQLQDCAPAKYHA